MTSLTDYLQSEMEGQKTAEIYKALAALMTDEQYKLVKFEEPLYLEAYPRQRGDLYAPKGIAGLGMDKPTMVEVKNAMLLPIFQRELRKGLEYVGVHEGEVYLVVYAGSALSIPTNPAPDIYFSSYDELLIALEKFKSRNTKRDLKPKAESSDLIERAARRLCKGHVTFILGSGISVDAGSPTWDGLLKELMKKNSDLLPLGKQDEDYQLVNSYCNCSPLITARYIVKAAKDEHEKEKLIDDMRELIYGRDANDYGDKPTALPIIAKIIKDCKVESAITFNYDEFLEEALGKEEMEYNSYYDQMALGDSFPVFHVHGLISRSKDKGASTYPVLSEREYNSLYHDGSHWSNVEILRALIRNTCFFVGLSMMDPNLRRLLDLARKESGSRCRHYLFLRRTPLKKDSDAEYEKKHQELLEQQFAQMGVNIIWYEYYAGKSYDHTDLATKLNKIYDEAMRRMND